MHVLLKMGPGVKINQNRDGNVGMLLKINTLILRLPREVSGAFQ